VNVAGLSILTRKTLVVRRFGGEAWGSFFGELARAHGCFRSLVTADTPVPLPAFLDFQDELMRRFFKGGEISYVTLGRDSCRRAVRDGPLKALIQGEDLGSVVAALPKFHSAYFKEASTWSDAAVTPQGVEFSVFDLPQLHPYFEHFIVGYISEILEMFCANTIQAVRLEGDGHHYRYLLHGGPAAREIPRGRDGVSLDTTRRLSSRELEVLQLVANGRTNAEIGDLLGISKKTAQHHVAHAYGKLGLSGRVTATLWLMEHGLLGE
jgi:DNA-binding CsgD family transcriptional regulator